MAGADPRFDIRAGKAVLGLAQLDGQAVVARAVVESGEIFGAVHVIPHSKSVSGGGGLITVDDIVEDHPAVSVAAIQSVTDWSSAAWPR